MMREGDWEYIKYFLDTDKEMRELGHKATIASDNRIGFETTDELAALRQTINRFGVYNIKFYCEACKVIAAWIILMEGALDTLDDKTFGLGTGSVRFKVLKSSLPLHITSEGVTTITKSLAIGFTDHGAVDHYLDTSHGTTWIETSLVVELPVDIIDYDAEHLPEPIGTSTDLMIYHSKFLSSRMNIKILEKDRALFVQRGLLIKDFTWDYIVDTVSKMLRGYK